MINNKLFAALVAVLIFSVYLIGLQNAFPITCDEVLSSCEEAVVSQEATIKLCEETSKKKDNLIDSVKEQAIATEKSLSNQKVATKAGFSLSGLLLLLLIL